MEKYPLSIDTALEAIANIIGSKFKEMQQESDPEQVQILYNELEMLYDEMNIIYGDGDEETRIKVYNKINDVYCPQIKLNFLKQKKLRYEFATD
jgi:hypothetical protein